MTIPPAHVVLGGNGVVGRETVRALLDRRETAVSVGRAPSRVDGAESAIANLLRPAEVDSVLRGASVAYLTAGLPYSARVWAAQWPIIVRNTIDAAIANDTHLVYFDNVYAYGRVDGSMVEDSPIVPSSEKGRIRAAALALLDEAASGGLAVTIGRSADFYGPGASTSVFNAFALDKIAAGKDATWLFDADLPHSMTYTPDIGDALALLGTAAEARGHVWHLPTAPALTGRQYVELAGGHNARTKVMSRTTMRIDALFNSAAREALEMDYQNTGPYVFDSSRFESTFGVAATPAAEGIAATLAAATAATLAEQRSAARAG